MIGSFYLILKEMKDAVILTLLFVVVGISLFLGATFLLKKSIRSTPKIESNDDYKDMLREQRQRMDDVQQRQKDAMRQQQQRIRDMQRR
jgi:hypothetical protein